MFADVVDGEWEPKPEGSGDTCVCTYVCVYECACASVCVWKRCG